MSAESVARYYDRNTRRFLLVGRGRDTRTIHRELWGPGVASASDAARYVDRLVADEIHRLSLEGPHDIVDLGCGVGGTLLYLARRFPRARLHGVTVSRKQVEIAARLSVAADLEGRCSFTLGDFHTTDLGVRADAVLAIEALAHSHDLGAFLRNASHHLVPGGSLLVVDDFLVAPPESLERSQGARVGQLRTGWRLPGLSTVEHLVGEARRVGFRLQKDLDLSRYTRPGSRMRDHLVGLCSPVLARLGLSDVPLWGNVIGGHALQIGLKEGFLSYRLLVFGGSATRS